MRYLLIIGAMLFSLSASKPLSDCRDHYQSCGPWAKNKYCQLNDYKDYMSLVCPDSCGYCDGTHSGASSSNGDVSDSGSSPESHGDVHRVIPETDRDIEHMEELGSSKSQADREDNDKDESESENFSGSGEENNNQLFLESASKETRSRSDEKATSEGESDNEQISVSGSGLDSAGANLWPVVRVEPSSDNRDSSRELQLSRRSEIFEPTIMTSDASSTSGPDQVQVGSGLDKGTQSSGEKLFSQRSELPASTGSGSETASGEDDGPFDNSAFDSESDSGCSSGYGCYESEGGQDGSDASVGQRSLIASHTMIADTPGSGSAEPTKFTLDSNADATVGPYNDEASASGADLNDSASERESDEHDIEDALFETGIPLQVSRDHDSGSASDTSEISGPAPQEGHEEDTSEGSGSGSNQSIKEGRVPFAVSPGNQKKISLMESMMKSGDLRAIKISHIMNVPGTNRNEVPHVNVDEDKIVQSDLGKGTKVSFVLNQDFYQDYANEDTAAYNVLAHNVKKEVEKALGSKAVVSEISFAEAREPGDTPRFSRVMTTFRLLGDVSKLENTIKKGSVSNLVVDKKFFKTS